MPTSQLTAAAWIEIARDDPRHCGLFCDIDGTLAPVVQRADDALVPTEVSRLLGRLSARLGLVACVSGRSAADAKRLVGVGGAAYAGAHGAEVMVPGGGGVERSPELEAWREPVRKFVKDLDAAELRRADVRLEDKDFIQALHWRGAEDDELAEELIQSIEDSAKSLGFEIHRGRKVLEIRPPVLFNKGMAVQRLVRSSPVRHAAYVGDDATDLDAFDALRALRTDDELDTTLCVGVRSEEQPPGLVERADLLVDGTDGVMTFLRQLESGE